MQTEKQLIDMKKKYRTRDGHDVRILCVDRLPTKSNSNTVVALVKEPDGVGEGTIVVNKYGNLCEYGDCLLDLVEVSLWDDFKIDDRVYYSKDGLYWMRGHFAGISDGKPTVFYCGATSFSNNTGTEFVKFCVKNLSSGACVI